MMLSIITSDSLRPMLLVKGVLARYNHSEFSQRILEWYLKDMDQQVCQSEQNCS